MARLGERLRRSQLLPSTEFMQVVYMVQENITAPSSPISSIKKLREKYAYNIHPCADPEDDETAELERKNTRPCPKPSRGGAFSHHTADGSDKKKGRKQDLPKNVQGEDVFVSGQKNPPLPEKELKDVPVKAQVKILEQHYLTMARHPAFIRCPINLAPPQARATCPQAKRGLANTSADGGGAGGGVVGSGVVISPLQDVFYGLDVPEDVVQKSKVSLFLY